MRTHDESTAQLIPLTDHDGIQAVLGRDLHAFLEVETRYRDWMPRMIAYGFTEGQDYALKNERVRDSLGREREAIGHVISLDMAKEISMIQRTDKGKQARQYFIECERQAQQRPALPGRAELAQWVLDAENRAEAAELENAALKGGEGIRIKDFIKTYFVAPNERRFFEWFYFHGLLIDGRVYNDDGTSARNASGPKLRWDHMHPTYLGRKYFKLVPTGTDKWGGKRAQVIPEKALDLVALLLRADDLPTEMTKAGREALDDYQRPGQLRLVTTQKGLPA